MRRNVVVAVLFLFLAGCAAYKELEPEPEVTPLERGYIELKNDKDNFELDKDKKYFIKFPKPANDHFYLVLVTRVKPALRSFLTDSFEGDMRPMNDETAPNDSVSVYAIDTRPPMYYWVIDSIRYDLELSLRYRYVPEWRYTFENRYSEFRATLSDNTVDRTTYNSIDMRYNTDNINYTRELERVSDRTKKITTMKEQLLRLASVFPPDIASSRDTAYQNYVALKNQVEDELSFQNNYSLVLSLFKKENETRGNTAEFVQAAPFFTGIISQHERFPAHILEKAMTVIVHRLTDVAPFYDNLLRSKTDIRKISPQPSGNDVVALYQACGQAVSRETEGIVRFIERFNAQVGALETTNGRLKELKTFFNKNIAQPYDSLYADLLEKANKIKTSMPESQISRFEEYRNYRCASLLSQEIQKAATRVSNLRAIFEIAGELTHYVAMRAWAAAETRLRELADDHNFPQPQLVADERGILIKRSENDIFNGVKLASEQRVDAFVKEHEMTIDNVPALYQDSAFVPVYGLTFSSLGAADLLQRRKQIEAHLNQLKYYEFPETAIKNIYKEFTRNMKDHGVEKARAIVDHGKNYRGEDKQVKGLVDECNVNSPKWIVKPADYRKLFALPVTTNKAGVNEYMFRIRLKIPSEAQFPVFDINLKLPIEVAEKAGKEQWYQEITIDKKPIKNEGRFRITSPTADNNYEAQISPVQMDKEGNNILEIRFKYPGFRVFEVSAMAQVPLIRKN